MRSLAMHMRVAPISFESGHDEFGHPMPSYQADSPELINLDRSLLYDPYELDLP